ncbi:hypothetical protein StrepF001_19890 [Streptomyces sp. F001]|nr:hypothetical protein StrepF001_19890 [Streptomyces sp. F001]
MILTAMILNERSVSFGNFAATVADASQPFRGCGRLAVTDTGDFRTWAPLLVSTGDPDLKGTAVTASLRSLHRGSGEDRPSRSAPEARRPA